MHTNEPRQVEGVELGYDPRDIQIKPLTKVALYFFSFTLLFFGAGAIVYIRMNLGGRTNFDTRKPKIVGPLVQGNITSKTDIMSMRQSERRLMTTYGTTPAGKQRIPVDRAINLIAERGLTAVASDVPAKSEGTTIPQNATGLATNPPTTGAPSNANAAGVATGTTTGGAGAGTTP